MPHRTPFGSIDYTFDHVPLTVVIVKTCTPNDFSDLRVSLKVVKLNLISNNYIAIFGIFIHESLNFKILQALLMSLCNEKSYKIKILVNI